MSWTIPGTALQSSRDQAPDIARQFDAMFFGGGMMLSQVTAVTGLEAHTVQNWVKRGFLPPPEQKRYRLNQLCRLATVNALKGVLSMEQICGLLRYVNGVLDTESDDLISDSQLYFLFVQLAAQVRQLCCPENVELMLEQLLQDYQEPAPGAKDRVKNALRIMVTAWVASRLCQQTANMVEQIEKENEP